MHVSSRAVRGRSGVTVTTEYVLVFLHVLRLTSTSVKASLTRNHGKTLAIKKRVFYLAYLTMPWSESNVIENYFVSST